MTPPAAVQTQALSRLHARQVAHRRGLRSAAGKPEDDDAPGAVLADNADPLQRPFQDCLAS